MAAGDLLVARESFACTFEDRENLREWYEDRDVDDPTFVFADATPEEILDALQVRPPRGLRSPCSPHGMTGRPRGPGARRIRSGGGMFASRRAALFDSSASRHWT
jgi:hypothetical protein